MGEVIAKVAALGAHLIDGVDGRNTEHAYSKGKNEFESGAHKDFGSQSPKAKAKRFDFRTNDAALPVRESKKARPTQRQKTATGRDCGGVLIIIEKRRLGPRPSANLFIKG